MSKKYKNVRSDVERIGDDIIVSERFEKAGERVHHKKTSVASHSLETAGYALRMSRFMNRHGFHVNEDDAVRASLMHDLGMTEDPVFESPSYKKAFSHPKASARIAQKEFKANEAQKDAVRRHMWPIGITPPHHITGWIVGAADKVCSVREVARNARKYVRDKRGNRKNHASRK